MPFDFLFQFHCFSIEIIQEVHLRRAGVHCPLRNLNAASVVPEKQRVTNLLIDRLIVYVHDKVGIRIWLRGQRFDPTINMCCGFLPAKNQIKARFRARLTVYSSEKFLKTRFLKLYFTGVKRE